MRSKGRGEEPATAAAAAAQYGSIAKWMVARRNNNREERFKMENVTKCIEFMSIVPHERGVLPPHHSIPFHSILASQPGSLRRSMLLETLPNWSHLHYGLLLLQCKSVGVQQLRGMEHILILAERRYIRGPGIGIDSWKD